MRKKTLLKIMELQTQQSQRHLEEVRSIYREMRGYRHDFHNHLQTLHGQIQAGEYENALSYIEELDGRLHNIDPLVKTGNVSVDVILSGKLSRAAFR